MTCSEGPEVGVEPTAGGLTFTVFHLNCEIVTPSGERWTHFSSCHFVRACEGVTVTDFCGLYPA